MASILESVPDRTEIWRFEQLLAAGFDERDALLLALDHDVDLHAALDLIEAGCPAELAPQILL